jgi:hypothetical protein
VGRQLSVCASTAPGSAHADSALPATQSREQLSRCLPLLSPALGPPHPRPFDCASWAGYDLPLYLGKAFLPASSRRFYRLDDLCPEGYYLPFIEMA